MHLQLSHPIKISFPGQFAAKLQLNLCIKLFPHADEYNEFQAGGDGFDMISYVLF